MTHVLRPLVVPAARPTDILPQLEEAISGRASYLPVPEHDRARADLLCRSQRAGEGISSGVALVVGTSGSTGTPKGAELSPLNLVSSADATHEALGGEGQWLLALPAHYIAGLQVLVRSLVAGVEPLSLDVSQGFSISAFARAAAELAATGERLYTSLTPLQLMKAMDTLEGIEAARLFTAILVGGAPLPGDAARAAAELGITVRATYGSSETSGGCVYDGLPLPGARVRLDGERIVLGGPMVARGYRNAPGHEAFAEPGWFRTSDAGQLADALLTVTGRLDAIIDTGGLKVHPEVVEAALLCVRGVRAACVVGIPHPRLGRAVAAAYEGTAQRAEVLEALDALPRWQRPRELAHVPQLPLTATGKIDRRAVAALLG